MPTFYPIKPVPAPRQNYSDRWQKRPCVIRYRIFRDEVRANNIVINPSLTVTFHFKAKKKNQVGKPHQQRPDIDNLVKALLDAVFYQSDDSHVWKVNAAKIWSDKEGIEIENA